MTVAVIGSSGFVGQATVLALAAIGIEALEIRAPRLRADQPLGSFGLSSHASVIESLADQIAGASALAITGGIADPDSGDLAALRGANTLLPLICFEAARQQNEVRVVHVSSAAVQGRRPVLDETWDVAPFSPYSASKADAERVLREAHERSPELTLAIYRPTSVQGYSRSITHTLAKLNRLPLVPVIARADPPVPLALIENVGAAIAHLATCDRPPLLATHPWEGITCRSMLDTFAPSARKLAVPAPLINVALRAGRLTGKRVASVAGAVRRAELLLEGQPVRAQALAESGYEPPVGSEGFQVLAQRLHEELSER